MPDTYSSNYQMNNDCPDDEFCTFAMKCYACDSAYALEEGFCMSRSDCRKYSKYDSVSSTCSCFDNFYITGVSSCSRCHIECLSCQGTGSSQCETCPEGASVSSAPGSCTYNNTYTEL